MLTSRRVCRMQGDVEAEAQSVVVVLFPDWHPKELSDVFKPKHVSKILLSSVLQAHKVEGAPLFLGHKFHIL